MCTYLNSSVVLVISVSLDKYVYYLQCSEQIDNIHYLILIATILKDNVWQT